MAVLSAKLFQDLHNRGEFGQLIGRCDSNRVAGKHHDMFLVPISPNFSGLVPLQLPLSLVASLLYVPC